MKATHLPLGGPGFKAFEVDKWARPDDLPAWIERGKDIEKFNAPLGDIVGKGGNSLLKVGPQPDGKLPAAAVECLREIGQWLLVNGEAMYGPRPIAPYKALTSESPTPRP